MRSNVGKVVRLGTQRFDHLIEDDKFYIDKTDFIREWWETGADVTLITRPRRFGKTLNMNMTEYFFSNKYAGRADLFEGLSIFAGQDGEKYRTLQGRFPVIALSFANAKGSDYPEMEYKLTEIISNLYEDHRYLLDGDCLSEKEKKYYKSIEAGIDATMAAGTLNRMACFMQRYYGDDVIILLDEYDTPMQEAWLGGYWDEAVRFLRGLFNSTFKTNPHMKRALITGITRISKESNVSAEAEPSEKRYKRFSQESPFGDSLFSDLNNLKVASITSDQYASSFGFTEEEVFAALDDMGYGEQKQKVKDWYDGFMVGSQTDIYNPWSITGFIENNGKYGTYWANTSGNGLVNSLIRRGDKEVKCAMEDLLAGGTLRVKIDEQIVFNQLNGSNDAIWSLFLATGYFKVLNMESGYDSDGEDNEWYTLAITNKETRLMFKKMIEGWFSGNGTRVAYNEFIKAMLGDNVRMMNAFMNKVALNMFSSFDSGNKASEEAEPERFYHGFVLGMIVNMADTYTVRSNRESGFGRYDVMLEPHDKNGKAFIFEFKAINPYEDENTLEETLANAIRQIEEKQYEAELVSRGFVRERIRKYGFAFRGKEVLIG